MSSGHFRLLSQKKNGTDKTVKNEDYITDGWMDGRILKVVSEESQDLENYFLNTGL